MISHTPINVMFTPKLSVLQGCW